MQSRDSHHNQSQVERRHPVMRCLHDPERGQLLAFLNGMQNHPPRLDELQEAVLHAVPSLRQLYTDHPDTPPLFHCEETLEALERAEQEGRQARFLWEQLMCAKQSNPAMPLSPNADPGPTVDACREQADHLKQFGIDVHIRGTAPVCIIPALKAGSSRLGHIATRGPTAEMLDICGILTSIELVSLTARHGAKIVLFELAGRWAMRMARLIPSMSNLDLARPDPQCRLFSGSPLRITVHSRVARSSRFIDLRSLVLLREVISDRVELGIGGGIGATYSRRTAGQENQLWPFDRLCADYALDFTDESNASLCAIMKTVSEAIMKILKEKGTGTHGNGRFQGRTVHGGPRTLGSGGCFLPGGRQPVREKIPIPLSETENLSELDVEIFERLEEADIEYMSLSLEEAGFFVAEDDSEDASAEITESFVAAIPLFRLRARLVASNHPEAIRFAEKELPQLSVDIVCSLLDRALGAADWDDEQLAKFIEEAKRQAAESLRSTPSSVSQGSPSTEDPRATASVSPSEPPPAPTSLPSNGGQSAPTPSAWTLADSSQFHVEGDTRVSSDQDDLEEDAFMGNDLGGEAPPDFPIETSDYETTAAAGLSISGRGDASRDQGAVEQDTQLEQRINDEVSTFFGADSSDALPHTDTREAQASSGRQIDMDTPMDDDFGGKEFGSSSSPAPVPPQEDAMETTSEISMTQPQSSSVQPEGNFSTVTGATTTLSAILPKMRFRKICPSSPVADTVEKDTHRPKLNSAPNPDPGSDMELSTGSTDGEDNEADSRPNAPASTPSSSAPMPTPSTSPSRPTRWTLPEAHDAAAASSDWARSYSGTAPSPASSPMGPSWSSSPPLKTTAFDSATSFDASRLSEPLSSNRPSFFSAAGSAVDRSSAPETAGAALSFPTTNAPPPLHSLRQYQGRAPTAASAFHPARAYGYTPATVEARTEVEILHEDLGPGEVTNVVGGDGKKNCSLLRVVRHPLDDPDTLELPVLKELLKDALGDVYDDLKVILIAPMPDDERWIVCKLIFKSEESFIDYLKSRRKTAVEIVKEHNDMVIKASLAKAQKPR